MPENEFCQTIQDECDPRNCNVEFCRWRDTVWVKEQMSRWAYSTGDPRPQRKTEDEKNSNKK